MLYMGITHEISESMGAKIFMRRGSYAVAQTPGTRILLNQANINDSTMRSRWLLYNQSDFPVSPELAERKSTDLRSTTTAVCISKFGCRFNEGT